VGDITYLSVGGQWRFLVVVLDQCSRRVLAWRLGLRRDARLTRAVFDAAMRRRQPPCGLIFHSDRGSEYAAAAFRDRLVALGVHQSSALRGPEDNAHMESFFHSLKPRSCTARGLRPRRPRGASSAATCVTTTTGGSTPRWGAGRRLTMSRGQRREWVSTKPREDPQRIAIARTVRWARRELVLQELNHPNISLVLVDDKQHTLPVRRENV